MLRHRSSSLRKRHCSLWDRNSPRLLPFVFFSDHHDELGQLVTEGRRNEFSGYKAFHHHEIRHLIPDPQSRAPSTRPCSILTSGKCTAASTTSTTISCICGEAIRSFRFRIERAQRSGTTASLRSPFFAGPNRHELLLIANFGSGVEIPLESLSAVNVNKKEWNLLLKYYVETVRRTRKASCALNGRV